MYNLWVVMCNKKSLRADFMPFFIDRKLLYPYCSSLLKVFFLFIATFNLSKTTCKPYLTMVRLVCLIFKVFSLLFSNFISLWTKVSRCVRKATRRVHYIGRYEHLIGRYGRIATRYMYIIQLVMLKLIGVMDKRQVVMYNLWVVMCNKKSLPCGFYVVLYRSQVVIPILQFVIESVIYS